MRSIVGTPSAESLGKHLGCNIEVDGKSSRKFQPLIEKVEQRISSWHHLSLSQAGRVLLINSILSMLSLNILSVFLIPKATTDKLNSIFAKFLWNGSRTMKPIYWKSMATIELPKGGGGLGIRNVHLFNKALLAKQAVRLHETRHSLLSQLYCAKYKASPVNFVLQRVRIGKASWGFRGLCRAIQDCQDGFTKSIGDGASTSILTEKWLKGDPVNPKQGINLEELGLRNVKDLMNQNQKSWNIPLVRGIFDQETATRILTTHIPTENMQDRYRWSASKSGTFKVKEVYTRYPLLKGNLSASQDTRQFWNKFWASDLRPKWKVLYMESTNKCYRHKLQPNKEKHSSAGMMLPMSIAFGRYKSFVPRLRVHEAQLDVLLTRNPTSISHIHPDW